MASLPDPSYGEQASFQEAQAGASMGAPSPAGSPRSGGGGPTLIPLDAPSARPDEPVTAGAALGPGVGPEALGLDPGKTPIQDVERFRSYLPAFIAQANRPECAQEFRNFVRALRTQLR